METGHKLSGQWGGEKELTIKTMIPVQTGPEGPRVICSKAVIVRGCLEISEQPDVMGAMGDPPPAWLASHFLSGELHASHPCAAGCGGAGRAGTQAALLWPDLLTQQPGRTCSQSLPRSQATGHRM